MQGLLASSSGGLDAALAQVAVFTAQLQPSVSPTPGFAVVCAKNNTDANISTSPTAPTLPATLPFTPAGSASTGHDVSAAPARVLQKHTSRRRSPRLKQDGDGETLKPQLHRPAGISGFSAGAKRSGCHPHGVVARPRTFCVQTRQRTGVPAASMCLGTAVKLHGFDCADFY